MRFGGLIAAIGVLAISSGAGCDPAAVSSPSLSPTPSSTASPSPTASPTDASYGLLLSGGNLQMITPSGTVAASARVAAPSPHSCGNGVSALLQPPVSATKNAVFYRSGNTTIRYVKPSGENFPLTTVPGNASKISFFSVSPNEDRIAVLVEDFLPAATINLTLYVEDIGHANHKVIYTSSAPKSKSGTTLWPMGWHQGHLVLAVFPVCKFGTAGPAPIEWHVADADTANRLAKIGNPCVPSFWPSPAGVVCIDAAASRIGAFDWSGHVLLNGSVFRREDVQSGLSPSGASYFLSPGLQVGAPSPSTLILNLGPPYADATVVGHSACLWIDDEHLLAPDAVIAFHPPLVQSPVPSASAVPTSTPTSTETPVPTATPVPTPSPALGQLTAVTPLPVSGECVGRFPGGL